MDDVSRGVRPGSRRFRILEFFVSFVLFGVLRGYLARNHEGHERYGEKARNLGWGTVGGKWGAAGDRKKGAGWRTGVAGGVQAAGAVF